MTPGHFLTLLDQHTSAMVHTLRVIPEASKRRGIAGRFPLNTMPSISPSEKSWNGTCSVASWRVTHQVQDESFVQGIGVLPP